MTSFWQRILTFVQAKIFIRSLAFLFFSLFLACSSVKEEELVKEGEQLLKELAYDLRACKNLAELKAKSQNLEKKFYRIAEIVISLDHLDFLEDESHREFPPSEELWIELKRLYRLEGAQEFIEKVQQKGLELLDKNEKTSRKQR